MSNLKTNLTSLEALIDKANALPEEKKIQASKTITPTKSAQTAQPDNGYDGLAQVTVEAIPAAYQDVTGVTATAARVASGDKFVDADGVEQTGKLMTDQVILSHSDGSLILSVYGEAYVSNNSTVLKGSSSQLGNADPSKVLAGTKFSGEYYLNASGTMPNNGTLSSTIDGLETKSVSIPKGYTDGGTVALDSTIDDTASAQATTISEIAALLEGKSVPGGSTGVETCTVTLACETGALGDVYYIYTVSNPDGTYSAQRTLVGRGSADSASITVTVPKYSTVIIDGSQMYRLSFELEGANFLYGVCETDDPEYFGAAAIMVIADTAYINYSW